MFYLRLFAFKHSMYCYMNKKHPDNDTASPPLPRPRLFILIYYGNGSSLCSILETGYYIPRHFGMPVVEH